MKLTENQIEQLYKFTRQHYVYHYDVQTELVDHLANDIEEFWKENPKLTFEQARDKSFKKFGIFGFMDVVEAKEHQLGKRYRSILWMFMKKWFTIPKIIITAFIFCFFYSLMSLHIKSDYLAILMLLLAIIDIVIAQRLKKESERRFSKKGKKFLLEDIIFRVGAFSTIIVFSNFFHLSPFFENTTSVLGKVLVSGLITIAIIYSYVSLVVIPQKAEELLQETYPEYKIVNNL